MSTTVRASDGQAQAARRERVPAGRQVRGYVALMKLRVVELLLVTTIPVMILAVHGVPDLLVVAATLVGGTLSAGAANAYNMVIDRDIDRVMHRTQAPAARHRRSDAAAGARVRGAAHGRVDARCSGC